MPPEERKHATSILSNIGIDISQRKSELTGTGVAGFFFENRFYEADSHKAVFLKIVEIVLWKYADQEEKIFEIKGTKKKYFSMDAHDFTQRHEQVNGTRIYADTNDNAAQLNRRCQRVLQKFGIDPSLLLIIPN